MKKTRSFIIIMFCIFISAPFAKGFGPHGNGKIGGEIERLQLPKRILSIQNFESPLSYPSLTRRDILSISDEHKVLEVEGRSSKFKIFLPITFFPGLIVLNGLDVDVMDRSVQTAIIDAKNRYDVDLLYDVKIDKNLFSILGIYNKETTIIHAKGIRINPSNGMER